MSINLEMNLRSSPVSQASAVDNFQLSGLRSNATVDHDRVYPHDQTTISTTSSNKPGQVETDASCPLERDVSLVARDENIDGLLTDWTFDQKRISAPKRLANGELKPSPTRLPTSPIQPRQYGHSIKSSRTSQISQMGEVRHLSQHKLIEKYLIVVRCPFNYAPACHMP